MKYSKQEVKEMLKQGIVEVEYMRDDGTATKTRRYTLCEKFMPEKERPRASNPPIPTPQQIGVWWPEKERWDGVRFLKVVNMTLVEE